MVEFESVTWSENQHALRASCHLDPTLPDFDGHFPGRPLLPAVSQMHLLQSLIGPRWGKVTGGSRLKFSLPLQPGDLIDISVQRRSPCVLGFVIRTGDIVAASGNLTVKEA